MKSGMQMNFIERRASAEHALSQLVRMVRETTETLSSREQGGVYQLESTLIEKSSTRLRAARAWFGPALAARWIAFSTTVIALVRDLSARGRAYAQGALARARAECGFHLARIFITLLFGFAGGGVRLRKLRARKCAERD